MAHQLPEADKIALADFVIRNDGELPLIPQVWQIHQSLSGK
jgi:dephospho-CoA kinase